MTNDYDQAKAKATELATELGLNPCYVQAVWTGSENGFPEWRISDNQASITGYVRIDTWSLAK